jgi:hypothetical protein
MPYRLFSVGPAFAERQCESSPLVFDRHDLPPAVVTTDNKRMPGFVQLFPA